MSAIDMPAIEHRAKRRRVPMTAVILWSVSIGMGLAASRAEARQTLQMNPHVYCGQTVTCRE